MINKLTISYVDYLIDKEALTEDEREWYVYGLETAISKAITYFSIALVGIIFNIFIHAFVYSVLLTLLRGRTGGYHAGSHLRCYLLSVGSFVISAFAACMLSPSMTLPLIIISLTGSILTVFLFAPVNHPNVNMSAEEISTSRKQAIIIVVVESVAVVVISYLGVHNSVINIACLSLLTASIFIVFAKLFKQEVTKDEEKIG